jgi:hypothetical protein
VQGVGEDAQLGELDPLGELRALFKRMKGHLRRAEETGNVLAIRLLGSELRQGLELFAKLRALAAADERAGETVIVVDVSAGETAVLDLTDEARRPGLLGARSESESEPAADDEEVF